ncbi:MAG: hypothetical protein M3P12_06535 [Gemmatimonadota bacterium]|nr:hypothetical protein [Gemmatimonadota bacterium]
MRFIFTLCAVALMTPVVGRSQQIGTTVVAVVDAGSRVRIAAPVFGPKKQVGTVVSLTRDTLVLRQGASIATRSVATSDITALEVSKGTYTRKGKGALWGLLIGAGTGAVLGYALYEEPKCSDPSLFGCNFSIVGPDSKGSNAAYSGVAGGIVGAVIGTIVGMGRRDAWTPATVGAR